MINRLSTSRSLRLAIALKWCLTEAQIHGPFERADAPFHLTIWLSRSLDEGLSLAGSIPDVRPWGWNFLSPRISQNSALCSENTLSGVRRTLKIDTKVHFRVARRNLRPFANIGEFRLTLVLPFQLLVTGT